MVLKQELAEMMVQIAPQVYCKYVTVDKKQTPILYVKFQKVLYGLMRASLMFYRKLRKELEEYGFVVNPYNPCVANMSTECGKQLTVIWHVNDLMSLCENDFELTKFLCYLGKIHGVKLSIVIGHGIGEKVSQLKWRNLLKASCWSKQRRSVVTRSHSHSTSDGYEIQVHRRHILYGIPYVGYPLPH
jgi:hypothetical protein